MKALKTTVMSLVAICAVGALFIPAVKSAAAQSATVPLMIQTVPAIPGAQVTIDGRVLIADRHGLVLAEVTLGTHRVSVVPPSATGEVRASFATWSDGITSIERSVIVDTFTILEAGFHISYRLGFEVVAEAGNEITDYEAVTLVDDRGTKRKVAQPEPFWLRAVGAVDTPEGIALQRLRYRVSEVIVSGKNLAAQGQELVRLKRGATLRAVISVPGMAGAAGSGEKRGAERPFVQSEAPSWVRRVWWALAPVIVTLVLMAPFVLQHHRRRAGTDSSRVEVAVVDTGIAAWVQIRRFARATSAVAFILGPMIGFWLFSPSQRVWVAQSSAVVEPAPGTPSWLRANKYDLLRREFVVPTIREIVVARIPSPSTTSNVFGSTRGNVETSVDPSDSAVITVSATAKDATTAEREARRVLHEGASYVDSLGGLFILEPFTTPGLQARPLQVVSVLRVAATLAVGCILAFLLLLAWPVSRKAR